MQRITSTTLQVISGTNALSPAGRMPSQSAQQARAALAFAVRSWAKESDATQQKWNAFAAQFGPQMGLPANGCAVYKSLVITKLLMGADPAFPEVPDVPDAVPDTPDFSVQATLSETGIFQLRVLSAAATGPFLVSATPSQSKGTSRFNARKYRVLEVSDNLAASGTSYTAAFLDVFLLRPSLGAKIAMQITPLTANGFRGTPKQEYTVVQALSGLEVTE